MLVKMTEFLNNLPSKKCEVCGKVIEEQCESYVNKCNKHSLILEGFLSRPTFERKQ
jgi:predicted nucleic acid-binding Zn ribbon protein